jgi:hypothetical protein
MSEQIHDDLSFYLNYQTNIELLHSNKIQCDLYFLHFFRANSTFKLCSTFSFLCVWFQQVHVEACNKQQII